MRRLVLPVFVVLAAACGSSPTSPTPTPTPTPTGSFTVTGSVKTAAPSNRPKGAVWVYLLDRREPLTWRRVYLDYAVSTFRFEDVQAGSVTIRVGDVASDVTPVYSPTETTFTLTADHHVEVAMTPVAKVLDLWLAPPATEPCPAAWNAGDNCQAMQLATHHSGAVAATLTWNASAVDYSMELWRGSEERIAVSDAAGSGRATLSGAAVGGQYHYIRVLGSRELRTSTAFQGTVTAPN